MQFLSRFASILLLGLLNLPPVAFLTAQPTSLDNLEEYVNQAMRDWQVPGLAVAVVQADSILFMQGFGRLDLRDTLPVDEHTLFAIASNSKAFTATAMGLLVQEKKVNWDDKVLDYLPDFQLYDPIATRKLTIRDLFCHRVGLGTWSGDLTWYGSRYTRDQVVSRIRFQKPVFDFRTGYGYSNLMYLVAGEVIESVTGQSWDEFVQERFFQPLDMRRSNTSVVALDRFDNVATPHTYRAGETFAVPYRNVDNVAPAAAINSSIAELTHWLQLQLNEGRYQGIQLVEPGILVETRTSHTLQSVSPFLREFSPSTHFRSYGLGWGMQDYHGRLLVQHTGGMDGMYSYTGFLPEENIGVIVLSNRDNHSLIRAIPYHIYDALLGQPFEDWNQKYLTLSRESEADALRKVEKESSQSGWSQPSLRVDQYLGRYRCQMYGEADLNMKGEQMILTLSAHPRIEGVLEHWQQDIWIAKWNDPIWHESKIFFTVDPGGGVVDFRMQVRPDWIDPFEYRFERR